MRINSQKANAHVMRYPQNLERQPARTREKTGYAVYRGIDDFLKINRIGTLNRYGEWGIGGTRIC